MVTIFLYIVLGALALVGLTEIISGLITHSMTIKNDHSIYIIVPNDADCNRLEMYVRSAVQKVRWMGNARPDEIAIICDNINEESLKYCKTLCNDYDFISIITKAELDKKITEK